ncbi:MucR family transcriptional regulator [Pseudochelatococcus sp. G4_1912]|uniref:MucR family transcriptional regulator n=1 Tax=Pseudochelatococcus sp. G4_1912 TaxID=3114288 RepID=UPI0039C6314D
MSEDAGQLLSKAELISVTADIVAAYIANNSLPPAEVLRFIEGVHATFSRLQHGGTPAQAAAVSALLQPASAQGLYASAGRVESAQPAIAGAYGAEQPIYEEPEAPRGPSRQVNAELSRKAQLRNPPNPIDPKTGALLPLEFEQLVPDEEGYVFDVAWVDQNAYVRFPPMTPIEKTVKRDSIICLENGKTLKVLKRHLDSEFGLTLDAYRKKWGLSESYPLVTHTFSTSRSKYAKAQGLGKSRGRG